MSDTLTKLVTENDRHLLVPYTSADQVADFPVGESSGLAAILEELADKPGQSLYLFRANGRRIYFLNLGEQPEPGAVLLAARRLVHQRRPQLKPGLGLIWLPGISVQMAEELAAGLVVANYQIGRFKGEEATKPVRVEMEHLELDSDPAELQHYIRRGRMMGETQARIMQLVDAPANKKHPRVLADWAEESGKKYGYQVTVMEKEELVEKGMHALLAVNRGSEEPPVMIVMEYRGTGARHNGPVALVGKGVTFDTGGLSIKGSKNLHLMKSDMGGAAAVLGAMELAARLELPVHLVGIVPSTDNSVDANAIKPSDVIESYSGKTIEIIDTDAEGRLILADGLSYAIRNFKPHTLIDLATLTGSAVRTFGYAAGALMTTNEKLANSLYRAGVGSGEKLWRLPLWDVFKSELHSDVADLANLGSLPVAGAITAGKFLEAFTEDHPRFAHLDIAGTAMTANEFATGRSATGFGPRLLVRFLEEEMIKA
ncbi:MAG: leucyl aminopeptidase family protein [Saprospiraceae bacterium]